jgi:CubicO group peptidase (beta-lactamase class C family)
MSTLVKRKPMFPGAKRWERVEPRDVGFDADRLNGAVAHARGTEIGWPTDVGNMVGRNDPPPYDKPFGPTKPRGPASGAVVRAGCVAAEWGDPDRVDMTFSATKSYLSTCVGLAVDRGMIKSVHDRVADYVGGDWFAGEHNGAITWEHLLQQTSEWSGTLFGIPDTVDHNRSVQQGEPGAQAKRKGEPRALHPPGTYWEYNDVRVNMLGFAALNVWREALPDVLAREIMEPIGATSTWQWHPYDNAYVEIDGQRMPSVPGGAHWGGGLWISALDHARFGLLWLAQGVWEGRRLISQAWIEAALTPCACNPRYGYMWWLNTDRVAWKNASSDAFAAQGAGGNVICVVPEHDLVVVTRWAGDVPGVVNRVIEAIE